MAHDAAIRRAWQQPTLMSDHGSAQKTHRTLARGLPSPSGSVVLLAYG